MSEQTYEMVIGLEVHVQLSTQSKAFCADANRFGDDPNTHVSVISLGHPGTLPRLNAAQVKGAVKLGLALGSTINERNTFDRKNYFYADLPKGYQITQDRLPVCVGGVLDFKVGEEWRQARIHHVHMEEDAGKLTHVEGKPYSLVDLNRAGVPLLEVVTEPDLRSGEEVDAFMTAMRQLVRFLGISDGNMEEGSMRCDVNLSIRKRGSTALNARCEIKNVNSMRYARQAIAYEFERQLALVKAGEMVRQQTLNFDPATGKTTPIRSKEHAHDYRYFPEPDLPPVVLSREELDDIREELPPLPRASYEKCCRTYGLSDYDATILTNDLETVHFFAELCTHTDSYKAAANLVINKILPWRQETGADLGGFPLPPQALASFLTLIEEGQVSNAMAYQRLFPALLEAPETAPQALAVQLNLIQTSDQGELLDLVRAVVADFPEKVVAYRKGKKGLLGFFMGEIMKRSRGKADPKLTSTLLRDTLEE